MIMLNQSKVVNLLKTKTWPKVLEILLLFVIAFSVIKLFEPIVKDNLILKQASVWIANIIMLIYVWFGIKIRGESCKDFGLTFSKFNFKKAIKIFLLSLLVFVIA